MKKGFTLIELLVVISIIGLLASMILASVAKAKLRSQDAVVKQEVSQLRTLLEENYSDKGTYADLETQSWFGTAADCSAPFTGTYASQATQVCQTIVKNSNSGPNAQGMLWIGTAQNTPLVSFSIMAFLPGKGSYYCLSSNGKNSDTGTAANGWFDPGCYSNP